MVKKKKKKTREQCILSNNCENIVRICKVSVIEYVHINNKYLREKKKSKKHK